MLKDRRKVFKWCAVLFIWSSLMATFLLLKQPMICQFSSNLMSLSSQRGPSTPRRQPIQHVYYLKIHKTGSTTMFSILAEYCRSHNLLPLLPRCEHINNRPPFKDSQVLVSTKVHKYDMVFNHHVYSQNIFKYLYNDTFRFTILREPLRHFLSSFKYFRDVEHMPYLAAIPGPNPIHTYLMNRYRYEGKGYTSYTNNRQAMDLGYEVQKTFRNKEYMQRFIQLVDERFDLILINEYYLESLVLLKRRLGWTTKDILFYTKLARSAESKFSEIQKLSQTEKDTHRNFSQPDIQIYNYFLAKFKAAMAEEIDLQGEVAEFQSVLQRAREFCESKYHEWLRLEIPAGKWTDAVSFLFSKCKWLQMPELVFTRHLQRWQKMLYSDSQPC